jgi:hypothetical protein
MDRRSATIRRLDALIRLGVEAVAGRGASTSEKIATLVDLGLTDAEVARIMGKEPKYVTAVKSARKGKQK